MTLWQRLGIALLLVGTLIGGAIQLTCLFMLAVSP